MQFVIPGTLPALNEIIGQAKGHWSQYARSKKDHTAAVALRARAERVLPIEGAALLHCTWYAPDRRKDPDNLAAAVKFILDGLVQAKVLPNDGWHQVAEIRHRFFVDKKNPRVEVELAEVAA